MNPFEIEILYHNESTKMMKELDINFSFDSLDIMKCTLFQINAVHPRISDGKEYVDIYVSSGVLTSPMRYDEFIELYNWYNP